MIIQTKHKAISRFDIIPIHTFSEIEIKRMLIVAIFLELTGIDVKFILREYNYAGRTALAKDFASISSYGSGYHKPYVKEKISAKWWDREVVKAASTDWSQIRDIMTEYPDINKFANTITDKYSMVEIINSLSWCTTYSAQHPLAVISHISNYMNDHINQKQFKIIIEF